MLFTFPTNFNKIRSIDLRKNFKATVTDNNDPYRLGRVKVSVPILFGSLEADETPWISPISSTQQGGKTNSSSFSVPEIASEILVTFPYNDIYLGFYVGYWQSSKTHAGDINDDYPDTYGAVDSTGTGVRVEKATEQVVFNHSSGASASVDKGGNIIIKTKGSITLESDQGDVGIKINDDIEGRKGFITTKSKEGSIITTPFRINNPSIGVETSEKVEDITGYQQVDIGGANKLGVGANQSVSIVGGNTRMVGGKDTATIGKDYERTAGRNISMRAVVGKASIRNSFTGITLLGGIIRMGGGTQPLLRGLDTIKWLSSHTHSSGTGPTGPPIEAAQTSSLLSKLIFGE